MSYEGGHVAGMQQLKRNKKSWSGTVTVDMMATEIILILWTSMRWLNVMKLMDNHDRICGNLAKLFFITDNTGHYVYY
jgi:hypothetical protein